MRLATLQRPLFDQPMVDVMKRLEPYAPMKLSGFNNLTKALSFNLYDFCVARNAAERRSYQEYILNQYSASKITDVLKGICDIIEAKVLSVSDQDYDPWGSSSMVLMSDLKESGASALDRSKSIKMHLDKSHICAHTYPDFDIGGEICTFRIDIDIATCGQISPLTALNYMIESFENDVVVIDYVVRGFTRDVNRKPVYMDHEVKTIQDYIKPKILSDYYCRDLVLQNDNIWQTKMLRTNMDKASYFANPGAVDLNDSETDRLIELLRRDMHNVLHMIP